MSEQDYFKKALSNFTYDAASGGAIRHLADVGYTVKQIMKELSYPTPYDRVQKTVWERLLDTGVILLEEPGTGMRHEQFTYVKEYDKYGKASFRRIVTKAESRDTIRFEEYRFMDAAKEKLADFLRKKCAENQESAYVSCNYGLEAKDADRWNSWLELLEDLQKDYILGLPWVKQICYHKLNERMLGIILRRLQTDDGYHACCYFLKTEEKVFF